jgi:hypothetical protein
MGAVAKRSPILGYNHNVRHRGLLFHVQTEDSGVDNPHIFTHLFHGGVIISSRKLQYDRESAEDVVKALMQAQHKASLRDLKSGTFDDKITSYLGDHPELLPAGASRARPMRETLESVPPPPNLPVPSMPPRPQPPAPPPLAPVGRQEQQGDPSEPSQTTRSGDVSNAFRLIRRETTRPGEDPAATRAGGKRRAGQTGYAQHRTGQMEIIPEIPDQPGAPMPRGKGRAPAVVSPVAARTPAGSGRPAGKPHVPPSPPTRPADQAREPAMAGGSAPARAGVVVSRPAIVVGAAPRVVSPREGAEPLVPRNVRRAREETRPSLFGKDLISERSLDEVILAYLSEDAADK